ncbi:MAG TPA: hypothetical protein VK890_08160 [Bacteroidia bacterium]|nr:hypothetical protein [Bacteroidia bacterium]
MRIPKGAIFAIGIFMLLSFFSATAQKSKGHKILVTKDNYRSLFTDANEMSGENFIDSALHTFLAIYSFDTSNANIAYSIGQLYLQTPTHKADALPYLEKAAKHVTTKYRPDDPYEKSAPPPTYYYLARAQHLNYQFDLAITNFNKFKKLLQPKDTRQIDIDYWIQCCNNGKVLIQSPVACKVINIGDSINSIYPDYCPVLTADEQELFFTSKRPALGDSTKDMYGSYFEDIWVSYAKSGGGWTFAKDIGTPVNTAGNDATVSISPDGQTLMVYKDNNEGDGNIYVSYNRGNAWTYPQFIDSANSGVINSPAHEPSASLSPDGQTLYFVSDRAGGLGGTDIYKVTIQQTGAWGNPVNLGPTINTPYDEDAPFIHPDDSTMFFSSKGHNTMGGFDVFVTRLNNKGEFGDVKNMGYPINTPDDDIYFNLSGDGKRAYYSSIRPGGYGEKDIYEVLFNTPMQVQPVAVLVGYIRTPDGSPLPSDILVTTSSVNGPMVVKAKVNPKTGKFLQVLKPNANYRVVIAQGNNNVYDQQFYLPADSSYINLSRSFFRTSITLGDTSNFMVPHKKQVAQAVAGKKADVMSGHLLDENRQALPMMRIQLLNDKDSVIATTLTDNTGYFTFDKLKADGNYILKVEATDSKLNRHFKDVYLADKDGRVVREYDTKKKDTYIFKHLPVDLTSLQLIAVDDNKLTAATKKAQEAAKYSKDTASMPKSDANFTRYFAYNVDKINSSDADFKALVDKIAAKAGNGQVTLTINGSASKVPTHAFLHSNKTLAHRRERETQDAIVAALKEKNIDTSKLVITVDYSVQGPAYEGDAADQVKYEKFQYVKVYIQ